MKYNLLFAAIKGPAPMRKSEIKLADLGAVFAGADDEPHRRLHSFTAPLADGGEIEVGYVTVDPHRPQQNSCQLDTFARWAKRRVA